MSGAAYGSDRGRARNDPKYALNYVTLTIEGVSPVGAFLASPAGRSRESGCLEMQPKDRW